MMRTCLSATAFLLLATGCALTSKSDSVILRYFTPERVMAHGTAGAQVQGVPPGGAKMQLHLGRVVASSYLRERIAFRDSDYEIGYYDDLRWTERPDAYVRRAMMRGLFEEQSIGRLISGGGPTLDIDLTAFEELRTPRHVARVELTWTLHDDRAVILQKTLLVERPIEAAKPDANPSAVATSIAEALTEAVKMTVAGVVAAMPVAPTP